MNREVDVVDRLEKHYSPASHWSHGVTVTILDLRDAVAEIERLRAWSNHLMDSGIILADAVMNARKNGYVLPAQLHNASVNPLDLFLEEKQKRAALKEGE